MTSDSLLVRVYSFSYHNRDSILFDPTGNGGGFVFDCRSLPNPHWMEELRSYSGKDLPTIEYFNSLKDVAEFLNHSYRLVKNTVNVYQNRQFKHLQIAFGCTGGKHRSVYCAEWMGQKLREQNIHVKVIHWNLEQFNKMDRNQQGMILAAGFGTRLLPLTETTPKALIKAGQKSMLEWSTEALIRAGCREIVINAHHHSDQIETWCESAQKKYIGTQFTVVKEKQILGTGGGIQNALAFLHSPLPILIHNCDIWSDYPLNKIYQQITDEPEKDVIGYLLVSNRTSNSYWIVDDKDFIRGIITNHSEKIVHSGFEPFKKLAFSGIHYLKPQAVEFLANANQFNIVDTYMDWIKEGYLLKAIHVEGTWFDMGSNSKLKELENFLANIE